MEYWRRERELLQMFQDNRIFWKLYLRPANQNIALEWNPSVLQISCLRFMLWIYELLSCSENPHYYWKWLRILLFMIGKMIKIQNQYSKVKPKKKLRKGVNSCLFEPCVFLQYWEWGLSLSCPILTTIHLCLFGVNFMNIANENIPTNPLVKQSLIKINLEKLVTGLNCVEQVSKYIMKLKFINWILLLGDKIKKHLSLTMY